MQGHLGSQPAPADQPRRRTFSRLAFFFVLIAVIAGSWFVWRREHKGPATSSAAATAQRGARANAANPGGRGGRTGGGGGGAVAVVVAPARQQDLPLYLDGLGSASAFNTVTLKSRIDGQLTEVDFTEGQDVRKGDLLAKIDPRPYEVALSQAQATLARDQSQLADAKHNQERDKELVAQGVIAQQQFDTQSALVGQLQGAVQADQAQVDSAKLNISYCSIIAPISGRAGLRLVDAGNMVRAADASGLLVITQVQPISVMFSLPEDNLPAVVARMRSGTALGVDAMSRDGAMRLASGKLLTIDNEIDQTTGTFRLKAVFDNPERKLWPNQFVNARLLLNVKKNATVIPSAAVQTGDKGPFVYLVKQDSTVGIQPITVDATEGSIVSIGAGLSPGDRVVTDGQDRLQAGMRVNAQSDARGGDGARAAQASGLTGASQEEAGDPAQDAAPGDRRGRGEGRAGDRPRVQVARRGAPSAGAQ